MSFNRWPAFNHMRIFSLLLRELTVQEKITKANGANLDADLAGQVNLGLHSLFREIRIELNGWPVSEPNQVYL